MMKEEFCLPLENMGEKFIGKNERIFNNLKIVWYKNILNFYIKKLYKIEIFSKKELKYPKICGILIK